MTENAPSLSLKSNPMQLPFAGDIFINERFLSLKKKYNIVNAIETGTYIGATFIWLYNNFDNIYSCELNPTYYQIACKIIFGQTRNSIHENYPSLMNNPEEMGTLVIANQGSIDFINHIAPSLIGESLFFLDAHWYDYCPLQDELLAIANQGLKPAVIAIHDFKTDHPDELGYDIYKSQPLELEWILPHIKKIYGNNWSYEYNIPDKSVGAMRGIIYIKRKDD